MKNFIQTSLLFSGLLCLAEMAQAQEILKPRDDSYVFINKKNENYSHEKQLFVRRLPGKIYNAFLKFDLSKLDAGNLNKAVLRLYCQEVEDPSKKTEVHVYWAEGDWKEKKLNYENAPKPRGGIAAAVPISDTGLYYEWDVTDLLRKRLNAGAKAITLRLSDQNQTGNGIHFASKEAGSNPPELVIN